MKILRHMTFGSIAAIPLIVATVVVTSGCNKVKNSEDPHDTWTWMGGSNVVNQPAIYGTQGTASTDNIPAARDQAITWTDSTGGFWLFGGVYDLDSDTPHYLNDLWRYDGAAWTWMGGGNTANSAGVYGNKGYADTKNFPGARAGAASWSDGQGNLWLFGGDGYGATNTLGQLSDLWKFDGTQWTWVGGPSAVNTPGRYVQLGETSDQNFPGPRKNAVSWRDLSGNLWLFGGGGLGSGQGGSLNDLWKFDGTLWTWIGGNKIGNQTGTYGEPGIGDAMNTPGARQGAMGWRDAQGTFWLFGGWGYDAVGGPYYLDDLWKFDGTQWTWVAGRDGSGSGIAQFGRIHVSPVSPYPNARAHASIWTDSAGNTWLLGGAGYDVSANYGLLSDLWRFDGTQWTLVGGGNMANEFGAYGTLGVGESANRPGARVAAATWVDNNGALWLFGGGGYASTGPEGMLNDLWRYQP